MHNFRGALNALGAYHLHVLSCLADSSSIYHLTQGVFLVGWVSDGGQHVPYSGTVAIRRATGEAVSELEERQLTVGTGHDRCPFYETYDAAGSRMAA